MIDNTFELLTKMYGEMTSKFGMVDHMFKTMNQRFDGVDQRLDRMDQRFEGIDQRLDGMEKKLDGKADKLDIVRLENKMDTNLKALYDGYIQNSEQISRIETKVDELSTRVGRHEVAIRVIRGGKDTNTK